MARRKSKSAEADSVLTRFSPEVVAAVDAFLHEIESRRRAYTPDSKPLSPLAQRLEKRIEDAFAGVTCYREIRMLLAGEAEDDYEAPDFQALLSPLEERDDWRAIPDDLLFACSDALFYLGPHAYKFLIPRFMTGALHGVVDIYLGYGPTRDTDVYHRWQMHYLDAAQQECLSDFLNLESVEWELARDRFLPWEHDEYHEKYAGKMDYCEYAALLLQRFREKEGIVNEA